MEQKRISESQKRATHSHIKYNGRDYHVSPLYIFDDDPESKALMLNDTMIDFYLTDYMYKEKFDDEARKKVQAYSTWDFTHLRTKIGRYVPKPPRKSELPDIYKKVYPKGTIDASIFEKELLIMPIHLSTPKHWFLVLIHNPGGAIHYLEDTVDPVSRGTTDEHRLASNLSGYRNYADASDCRIIIMDSLLHAAKYQHILPVQHKAVTEILRIWLQMIAGQFNLVIMNSRIKSVICRQLPKQINSYDCGIYVLAYAEYFTFWNTDWLDMTTPGIQNLTMDETFATTLRSGKARRRLQYLVELFREKN